MSINKKVKTIIDSTVKDLIDGKYQLIEKGQYTNKVKYKDSVLDIWISNGEYSCSIYGSYEGLKFPDFDDETKKIVYALATTESEYHIKSELKRLRRLKKECYGAYKDKTASIEELKEKLKTYKK